jgi:hypothetical protein
MTDGWQPIESAPRDGTHILLGSTEWGPPRTGHGFLQERGFYCPYTGESLAPTHWQHIPTPPVKNPPVTGAEVIARQATALRTLGSQ